MTVQHPMPFFNDGDAFISMIEIYLAPSSSRPSRDEIAPAHQVVGGRTKAKQPIDEASAAVAEFAEERDGLQPAEGLLDQLPLALTQGIARMTRGATINRAAAEPGVLGHVRRDAHPAHGPDPGAPVVQLVRGHGDAAASSAATRRAWRLPRRVRRCRWHPSPPCR